MLFSCLQKTGLCLLTLALSAPGFSQSASSSSAPGCGATASYAASSVTTSASALTCQVNVTNRWGSGYQVDVKVGNAGATTTDKWSVVLDVPAGDSLVSAWNAATLSQTVNAYTYGNLNWNNQIAPNDSVNFGATLNGTGTPTCHVFNPSVNHAPSADFTAQVINDTVHFQATATDPEGDKLTTSFDFGDGKTLKYKDVWHTYKTAGNYNVSVTVSDGKLSTTVIHTVVVGAAGTNHAPSAMFSYSTSGLNIPVNAKASMDIDDNPLTYVWDFGSGSTAASTVTTATGTAISGGSYVTLTVFDGQLGNTQQIWVSASTCNTSDTTPNLKIASNIINLKLDLDASESSNADSFTWDFGDGSTGTGMFASHTYLAVGTYVVTLKATAQMMSATKTTTVVMTQEAQNLPPIAELSCFGYTKYVDDFVNYISTITFEAVCGATGSYDPEGATLRYTIDWGDGKRESSSSSNFSHTYTTRGVVVPIVLQVSDGVNYTYKTINFLTSEPINKNPIPAMTCTEVEVPAANPTAAKTYVTQCDATASTDPEGKPLTYELQWGDGIIDQSTTGRFSHGYAHGGYYRLTLKVSDGVSWDFKIEDRNVSGPLNTPPVACFNFYQTANVGPAYTGSIASCSSDDDGDPLTYFWDFGDGQTATGVTASHTYTVPGTYVVTLYVNDGATESSITKTFVYAGATKTSHCEFKITNEWNGGFTGWLRVFNDSTAPISNWSAQATFAGASKVNQSWNGTVTGTNPYAVSGVAWNNTIQPGAFSEVGFIVWNNGSPNSLPALAGASCQ